MAEDDESTRASSFPSGGSSHTQRLDTFLAARGVHKWEDVSWKKGQTMDLLFVGITTVFFLASWGFVKLCEHI